MNARKKTPAPAAKVQRGRPPIAEVAQYRERILDATAAVFLEKGFERASTNEIALRAQASKQTIYSLFPTKAELFVGVMTACAEQLYAPHTYYIESNRPPREALTSAGEGMLRLFRSPEFLALYRILVAQVQTFPKPALALSRAYVERGYGLLAEYLQSRQIGGPDYHRAAARFVSFVLGDFVINATLDPGLRMSDRALRARVKEAVDDFFRLYPEPTEKEK
jgi:AcrR family transcriptional regulator